MGSGTWSDLVDAEVHCEKKIPRGPSDDGPEQLAYVLSNLQGRSPVNKRREKEGSSMNDVWIVDK